MKIMRIEDFNNPAGCSGMIDYGVHDMYESLINVVEEQNPQVLDEHVEEIFTKTFRVDEIYRSAVNAFGCETEFRMQNMYIIVKWVKLNSGFTRVYSLSAEIEMKDFKDEWRRCDKAYGNQTLLFLDGKVSSIFYYFCRKRLPQGFTAGDPMLFGNWKECLEDMCDFDAADLHYAEVLEDILGDAG